MIRIIAFDFEASALVDGFPVSIGVARSDGALYQALIKPHDDWLTAEFKWDPVAATMHGYSIERLRAEGTPPAQIVNEINVMFAGEMLVSDAPALDTHWMRELNYAAGGIARFDVRRVGLDAVLTIIQDEVDMHGDARREIAKLRASMHTHHALSDAASWIAALEAVEAWAADGRDLRAAVKAFQKWHERVATRLAGMDVVREHDATLRELSKSNQRG